MENLRFLNSYKNMVIVRIENAFPYHQEAQLWEIFRKKSHSA